MHRKNILIIAALSDMADNGQRKPPLGRFADFSAKWITSGFPTTQELSAISNASCLHMLQAMRLSKSL